MKSSIAAACAALGLALAVASGVRADAPEVTDIRVDAPDRVTVGDRLRYEVVLEADEGTQLTLVRAALPPEVGVVDTPRTRSRPVGGGRAEIAMTFELAAFVTGQVDVPPLVIRYATPSGEAGEVQAPASRIAVESVLPPGDLEPKDLKPQAEIGAGGAGWFAPAAAGAALAAAAAAALFWRRRQALKRRRLADLPRPLPVPALGPEDRARAVLDRAGAAFAAEADYVAYYTALGSTVRTYLTERYAFPAFALTTRELEREMLARGLDRWQVRVASGLLQQCDAVVYARYRPAAERADADLTAAYEVVEMSRPRERQEAAV